MINFNKTIMLEQIYREPNNLGESLKGTVVSILWCPNDITLMYTCHTYMTNWHKYVIYPYLISLLSNAISQIIWVAGSIRFYSRYVTYRELPIPRQPQCVTTSIIKHLQPLLIIFTDIYSMFLVFCYKRAIRENWKRIVNQCHQMNIVRVSGKMGLLKFRLPKSWFPLI